MIDKVILIILALGFFACCSSYYQAHGMSEETSRNITATITATPGNVINSVTVTPLIPGVNEINFTGTWAITTNPKSVPTHDITGIPTITFDGFMHNVCCWNHKEEQVYLQPFTAYVGHRTFKGYWEFDLSFFNRPNTLQLCANSTDVKHIVGVSPILSRCTSMTVKIVNNNHVELLNPAVDTMHLIRLEKHLVPGS